MSDGEMEEGDYGSYKTKWNELQRKYQFIQTFIQPHVPWQNTAELDIGHIRRKIARRIALKCSPKKLWGYCGMYCAGIMQRMAFTDLTALGRTAYEQVHGYTPDITLYTMHDWYNMIFWFCSLSNTQHIGRYLGPCEKLFGAGDFYFILGKTGEVHAVNLKRD